MKPQPADADRANPFITLIVVVVAASLWIAVAGVLQFVVPFYEKVFADFKLQLPAVSAAIIAVSRWCVKYPYVLPLPLGMVIAAVVISTLLIRHGTRRRLLAALWCLAMLALPVAVGLSIWLAFAVPLANLLDGLAGQKG
jgi:type II secretory pathway component PulF